MSDRDQRLRLIKAMEKELNFKRYVHTLGVAYTSTALAMRYGVDADRAETAGLLHDCAKCISCEKMQSLCRNKGIPIPPGELDNPALLHSKAGSVLAQTEYGVNDPEILSAIAGHTTGHPGMTDLEKIIFIADYIEPGRSVAENLDEIRRCAFRESLDKAMCMILRDTLAYLKTTGEPIDPATQETYDYYKSREQ
ncbi:MAG: bis(5'-nucleosyl)-tetraphosphatase (symmetrical) YqeK [Lachnospiraceae bacterium]|nr:bis(5'-nucleosyl)-tetraphosphatase (symmetrical) YqeK [Lachnospiraceae bacterium]